MQKFFISGGYYVQPLFLTTDATDEDDKTITNFIISEKSQTQKSQF